MIKENEVDYVKIFRNNKLNTIEEFFRFMQKEFNYGWLDINNQIRYGVNDAETYSLQTPFELIKNKVGNCWDMVELYRCFFETMTDFQFETYYLFFDDEKGCPSHSILVYYAHHKVYWFEPMFQDKDCYFSGIHEYDDLNSLLYTAKQIFTKYALKTGLLLNNYSQYNFYCYKYEKPNTHINGYQMRNHINQSSLINISQHHS